MLAYCPRADELVPGLPDAGARRLPVPALVFRSGASDPHHTRATSERLAELLPSAELVEPPWGDREWTERVEARGRGRRHVRPLAPAGAPAARRGRAGL